MKSEITGLDWVKLAIVLAVFVIAFLLLGSIWSALIWAYVAGVILFRIDNRPAGYIALGLLTLTPIALSLKLDKLAEALAVNVYYLLCIMVFSEIWSGQRWRWQGLENLLDSIGHWTHKQITKIPNYIGIIGILLISLVYVSGKYFFKDAIPHNSFLDMGGGVVHLDVFITFWIGWFYQFGFAWNILTSNWAVLYTHILSFLAGDFYLGIKIHQLISIGIAAVGIIKLMRVVLPQATKNTLGIGVQILATLIYILNPFYLSVLNGVMEFGIAYALLPWIVNDWIWLMKHKPNWFGLIHRTLVLGIIVALSTLISGITMVFSNIIPLVIIMLGIALIDYKSQRELVRRLGLFSGVWIIVCLLGLHMLMPTFFGYRANTGLLDESQTKERIVPFVKDYYSPTITELVYLQNKEGIVSGEIGYSLKDIPLDNRIIWLIWTSFGIISILWFRRNKYILPLWIGSGIAGYLALGYSKSWLYRVLNEYFPYFWGLRTPGRFMMIFALGIAILGGLTWYYVVSEMRSKQWRMVGVFSIPVFLIMILVSARYQGLKMYTFYTVPSMEAHYPGIDRAKKLIDELNPNQEYRILDLTRDDDGAWNHTRAMAIDQRVFNNFEKILPQYSVPEWVPILRENNVKYIVTTSYNNYCDDRFKEKRNLVACYLLERKSELKWVKSTIEGYRIYEVPEVQEYVSGDEMKAKFSYNPIVRIGDKEQNINIAEVYNPQFKWDCGDKIINTKPERNGLTQSAILPANSECEFGYHKARSVVISEIISYGLIILAILGAVWLVIKKIWYWGKK
jgi:hypothetical protein